MNLSLIHISEPTRQRMIVKAAQAEEKEAAQT